MSNRHANAKHTALFIDNYRDYEMIFFCVRKWGDITRILCAAFFPTILHQPGKMGIFSALRIYHYFLPESWIYDQELPIKYLMTES